MTLGVVPSDRDARTRSAASRNVDLETRYVIVCVGACCGRGGDFRTRSTASRNVDLKTRYVIICVGTCCGKGWEKRDNKVNVYLPSLMMKVPNHL
jgi:hypothetical protein